MISLRNLAEQQKNHRASKFEKKRILKQTHDTKLAENKIPQLSNEHTTPNQSIEINKGVIYDTELENTFKNMKNKTVFLKQNKDPERGVIWNGYPIKISGGTEVEINDRKNNMTSGI